jgi:membrane-associated phospholipid phosphatase
VRVLAVLCFFAAWWAAYSWTNARGADPLRAVYLTRPCDLVPNIILPWTAVVYLAGGLALPLLPFFYYREWPRLRFVLAAYAIASALAFACYLLWPLCIVRPAYEGPGLGNWLMRQVVAVDDEANCFPSSHALFAVLPAILVSRGGAGRGMRIFVWALAVAVCLTTVTTGQHYFLDMVGGAAAAVAGYLIARQLFRRLPGGVSYS